MYLQRCKETQWKNWIYSDYCVRERWTKQLWLWRGYNAIINVSEPLSGWWLHRLCLFLYSSVIRNSAYESKGSKTPVWKLRWKSTCHSHEMHTAQFLNLDGMLSKNEQWQAWLWWNRSAERHRSLNEDRKQRGKLVKKKQKKNRKGGKAERS